MTNRKYREYSPEFKAEAVKLVTEQGYKQIDAARNLGIEASLLGKWVRTVKDDANIASVFPGKGKLKPASEEVSNLKKQLNKITRERDILKKALGYFASQPE